MKKIFKIFFLSIVLFVVPFTFTSCLEILGYILSGTDYEDETDDDTNNDSSSDDQIGDYSYFWIGSTDANGYFTKFTQKQAQFVAQGSKCKVYYLRDSSKSFINPTTETFQKLADKFDSFYEKECAIFGSNVPTKKFSNIISISSDTPIYILCFDIDSDATYGNYSGTYGYFGSNDMYTSSYLSSLSNSETNGVTFRSNQKQIFYVDSYFAQDMTDMVVSTLAHEFQHMLQYVNKTINLYNSDTKSSPTCSTWFNEMQSMLAEELLQKTLEITDANSPKSRLTYFNVGSNYGFTSIWDVTTIPSGTFDYANSYSFGTFLMHNYKSTSFVNQIAKNNYSDFNSIIEGLESLGYTKTTEQLLAEWATWYVDDVLQANNYDSSYPLDEISLTNWQNDTITNTYKSDDLFNSTNPTMPFIYNYNAKVELYSTGFSVHYLGTVQEGGSTYTFDLPSDENIVFYIYCDDALNKLSTSSYTLSNSLSGKPVYLIKINTGNAAVSGENTGSAINHTYSANVYNLLNNNSRSLSITQEDRPIVKMGRPMDYLNNFDLGELVNEKNN